MKPKQNIKYAEKNYLLIEIDIDPYPKKLDFLDNTQGAEIEILKGCYITI